MYVNLRLTVVLDMSLLDDNFREGGGRIVGMAANDVHDNQDFVKAAIMCVLDLSGHHSHIRADGLRPEHVCA